CVVTELDLPDRRGLDVLRMLRAARPEIPIVVCTRSGSGDAAVPAMKPGAADYVPKQGTETSQLVAAVRAAAGRAVLSGLDEAPSAGTGAPAPGPDAAFVATTARMRQALLLVERAAHSRVPVLLEGETGTGKELLARAIHTRGRGVPRRAWCRTAARSARACSRASSSDTCVAPSPARSAIGRDSSPRRARAPSSSTRS